VTTTRDDRIAVGCVVQIIDVPDTHRGWLGAFVIVTEIKSWGVQGFVHVLDTHHTAGQAFTRLKWDRLAYIGDAVMLLGGSRESDHPGS